MHENDTNYAQTCGKCGARRVDQQIGLEATPDEWVARLVDVFREVRRVLRSDGVLFLEIGDSYSGGPRGNAPDDWSSSGLAGVGSARYRETLAQGTAQTRDKSKLPGIKPKDLIGGPWLLAEALKAPYYTGKIRDERDRIWLAATIEAEGCLFIHKRKAGQSNGQGYKRKNDTYGAGLEVASTDRVIAERCMEIVGLGSISEQSPDQNPRRKQTIYRWNLRTNECRDVIRELYPHLIAKKHEARLLIGCPSSGDDARKAWESLKALHQGHEASIDFREPEGMWERGWYLRSEIIWSKKPNPMPESVSDRPTTSHSRVFLLTKSGKPTYWTHDILAVPGHRTRPTPDYWWHPPAIGTDGAMTPKGEGRSEEGMRTSERMGHGPGWRERHARETPIQEAMHNEKFVAELKAAGWTRRNAWRGHDYFYDAEAIREPAEYGRRDWNGGVNFKGGDITKGHGGTSVTGGDSLAGRNRRSVWEIATQPYPEAHFATWPERLVEPMVLAGTSERGVCPECGAPWERITTTEYVHPRSPRGPQARARPGEHDHSYRPAEIRSREETTTGWQPTCAHNHEPVPAVVLDVFVGSGTTCHVARRLGRRSIGIDLSADYLQLAAKRLAQQSLLAEGAL